MLRSIQELHFMLEDLGHERSLPVSLELALRDDGGLGVRTNCRHLQLKQGFSDLLRIIESTGTEMLRRLLLALLGRLLELDVLAALEDLEQVDIEGVLPGLGAIAIGYFVLQPLLVVLLNLVLLGERIDREERSRLVHLGVV